MQKHNSPYSLFVKPKLTNKQNLFWHIFFTMKYFVALLTIKCITLSYLDMVLSVILSQVEYKLSVGQFYSFHAT